MQITVSEVENAPRSLSESPQSESTGAAKFCTLPYQASHQVELLHLHAEIESLLQQVRTLKQQRLTDDDHVDSLLTESSEVPALSLR